MSWDGRPCGFSYLWEKKFTAPIISGKQYSTPFGATSTDECVALRNNTTHKMQDLTRNYHPKPSAQFHDT
jgi:hypothetical protein